MQTGFVAGAVLLALSLSAVPGHSQQGAVTLKRDGKSVQVEIGGKPFTTYYFDPEIAKAFLHPLRDPNGIVITRDFPPSNNVPAGHDQDSSLEPHQRDMYFGHGDINGYDFWSEQAFAKYYGADHPSHFGRMVFRKLDQMKSGSTAGTVRATFDLEGPDHKPFAEEVQEFTFRGDASERVIDAVITFHATHGPIKFGDTKEGTFALRLAPALDAPTGTMVSSEGGTGEPQIWGKRANWVNVDGVIDGRSLGVAIFDNPSSFHHPTYWHARGYGLLSANPFGLSFFLRDPHQNGSYTVPAGKSLEFRYRVLIHDGDYKQAHVADQYSKYAGKH